MYALLVLGDLKENLSVVVSVKNKEVEQKFYALLKRKKNREAFNLLKEEAQVRTYLPEGKKISRIPQVTLVESLL
jgi:hypothetical protein